MGNKHRADGVTLFTTGQVAEICQMAPSTTAYYCDNGDIVARKSPVSNHRRVTRENLEIFMDKHGIDKSGLDNFIASLAKVTCKCGHEKTATSILIKPRTKCPECKDPWIKNGKIIGVQSAENINIELGE